MAGSFCCLQMSPIQRGFPPPSVPHPSSDCPSHCPLLLPSSPRCPLMSVTLLVTPGLPSRDELCGSKRPLPDQFTTTALGLNTGPVHYKYSTKTCQLWPGCPHFTNGKAEVQRRPFRSSGSSLPWSVLYVWAPCLGQGVGFSPCLPWKEVMMLKK